MTDWTKREMDSLMWKLTQKTMTDAEFRKEVLKDATKALEKLAGRPLPPGMTLKAVEKDPGYQSTLLLPDFLDKDKMADANPGQAAENGEINIKTYCFADSACLGNCLMDAPPCDSFVCRCYD